MALGQSHILVVHLRVEKGEFATEEDPLCVRVHMHIYAHPPQSTSPTHLHGLLQVLSGCTEAVGGEILHNRVDPLPLYLTDVDMYTN